MRFVFSFKIGLLFVLAFSVVMFTKSCSGNYLMATKVSDVLPDRMNIVNSEYVPDPRNLKSTKWNYLYSFAILTQRDWYAVYLADNVLRSTESNNVDSYIVGRKIWKETRWQSMQISYLEEISRDTNGNPILTEEGKYIYETNACAFGLMQVNLKIHKKRLLEYNSGALRPFLGSHVDYIREILKVPVNTDIGTGIFRMYLDMFDNKTDYALCAYLAGENSSYLRNLKNGIGNEYVTWIMDEKKALSEMTLYSFVNPETRETNKWRYIQKRDEMFFVTNK
jgi:hypothetical protein